MAFLRQRFHSSMTAVLPRRFCFRVSRRLHSHLIALGLLGFNLSFPSLHAQETETPPINLTTALDDPALVWTLEGDSSDPPLTGTADAAAMGGSLVWLPASYRSQLVTTVTGPCLFKLRNRSQQSPLCSLDGWQRQPSRVARESTGEWQTWCMAVPAGAHRLAIFPGTTDLALDHVERVLPPASLTAVLGLTETGTALETGGSANWSVAADEVAGRFVARVDLSLARTEGWLEAEVKGPAELVTTNAARSQPNALFALSVDGEPVTDLLAADRQTTYLYLPPGRHRLRWTATMTGFGPAFISASLEGILLRPLAPPTDVVSALNPGLPYLESGIPWSCSPATEGSPEERIIEPSSPLPRTSSTASTLTTRIQGAGWLTFQWRMPSPDVASSWSFTSGPFAAPLYRSRLQGQDRGEEQIWMAPGPQHLTWRWVSDSSGDGAERSPQLGGLKFSADREVSLAEALDASGLTWETDPATPWTGWEHQAGADSSDVAVSASSSGTPSSYLRTQVEGPGLLSFRWKTTGSGTGWLHAAEEKPLRLEAGGQEQETTLAINTHGIVPLEWLAASDARIQLDQVRYVPIPIPAVSLETAMETPEAMRWTTSSPASFSGQIVPGAKNSTAAVAPAAPGEEAWLEGVVSGPGIFRCRLLEVTGTSSRSWKDARSIRIMIDGQQASNYPRDGEDYIFWITGSGEHRIRLIYDRREASFPQPTGTIAMDDVSWTPLQPHPLASATSLPDQNWEISSSELVEGFLNASPQGNPVVFLKPDAERSASLETEVEGPCELSWDSLFVGSGTHQAWLQIDGGRHHAIYARGGERFQLSLPAGSHRIRWYLSIRTPYDFPGTTIDLENLKIAGSGWTLGNMLIRRGLSETAEALDDPEVFALLRTSFGAAAPARVEHPEGDALELDPQSILMIFHPTGAGRLSIRWKYPLRSTSSLYEGYPGMSGISLPGSDTDWQESVIAMGPGQGIWWNVHSMGEDQGSKPLFDSLHFQPSAPISPGQAMDFPLEPDSFGWYGLPTDGAPSGGDAAWSGVSSGGRNQMALPVTGPAIARFWWRLSGGSLNLSLDQNPALVPSPTVSDEWQQVECYLPPGDHYLVWRHSLPSDSPRGLQEAWIDELTITPTSLVTLTQAASLDPQITLTAHPATPDDRSYPWEVMGFRDTNGSWIDAARVCGGSRLLSTTVSGPTMLRFKARCFHSEEYLFWFSWAYSGQYLVAEVDGSPVWRIAAGTSPAWQDAAIAIPEGDHQISFRLISIERTEADNTEIAVDSPLGFLQGWIDDLQQISPQDHYLQWAAAVGLADAAALPAADPDGDGFSNFVEYALGTGPRSAASRPVFELTSAEPLNATDSIVVLKLPYLKAHATSGYLERSTDLLHWTRVMPLPSHRPLRSQVQGIPGVHPELSTDNYEVISLLAPPAPAFYRLNLAEPSE